jgi:hypothetical protein
MYAPLGGGAPASWNPANLTALRGWYRADGTMTLVGGTDVQQWDDRSGIGNHMTAAAAGNRPLYLATDGPNGTPTVRFAVGDWLRNNAFSWGAASTAHSIFFVATAANPGTARSVVDYDGTVARTVAQFDAADKLLNYESGNTLNGTTLTTVGARLWGISTTYGGRMKAYKGITEEGDAAAPAAPGPADSMMLTFCANILGTAAGVGDVAELIITRAQLTAGELTSLGAYISGRYGAGVL